MQMNFVGMDSISNDIRCFKELQTGLIHKLCYSFVLLRLTGYHNFCHQDTKTLGSTNFFMNYSV